MKEKCPAFSLKLFFSTYRTKTCDRVIGGPEEGGGGGMGTLVNVCWVCVAGLSEPYPIIVRFFFPIMRPHYSHSIRENATPLSATSPLASCKGVPHPPGLVGTISFKIYVGVFLR